MNSEYYQTIFKRKSFHLFRNVGNDRIETSELKAIQKAYETFETLYPDIRTAIRIVPAKDVIFKRDAEYCILLYSEEKDNYLMNVGYIGQQLELYLVAHNIGTLWFGIGKADMPFWDGLSYVIMIALHKANDVSLYRKDMFKAKRKPLNEIWEGDTLGVGEIARFAPSACNTQPWYVRNEDGILRVFRHKKAGKRGIMPLNSVSFYNRIDMGIFLCILEICMAQNGITAERNLFLDNNENDNEFVKVAEYAVINYNLRATIQITP